MFFSSILYLLASALALSGWPDTRATGLAYLHSGRERRSWPAPNRPRPTMAKPSFLSAGGSAARDVFSSGPAPAAAIATIPLFLMKVRRVVFLMAAHCVR